jgi:hypothetical protein
MERQRRFTGRQITTMVVAAMLAVVAAPVGAMAATGQLINIADPGNATQVAHVDAGGHLEVGDGSGALTVDGTIRPQAPAAPWSAQAVAPNGSSGYYVPLLLGPTSTAVNVTSLSITIDGPGYGEWALYAYSAPASSTSVASCNVLYGSYRAVLWEAVSISAGVPAYLTFPTPLQYRPVTGTKACLMIETPYESDASDAGFVSAGGFYGT